MRYLFIVLALLTASCGTALPTVKPYKMDVQQGNVVTSKMLLQLRPGMTKSQVRFIMGTPLIQDSFHGNRWDYVYQMREAGKITEQRRVILEFENELLKKVRGDVVPAGSDEAKALAKEPENTANSGSRVVAPVKKSEEKSFMSKLKFWEKDETELAKEAAAKESKVKGVVTKETAPKQTEPAKEGVADVALPSSDEPKSMLAVPLEAVVLDAPIAKPAQPSVEAQPSTKAPAPVEEAKKVLVPVQESTAAPATEVNAAEIAVQARPRTYASSSGMLFDRELSSALEVEAPNSGLNDSAPRAGNTSIPKPRSVPAEKSPSYFDRMLEMIGF